MDRTKLNAIYDVKYEGSLFTCGFVSTMMIYVSIKLLGQMLPEEFSNYLMAWFIQSESQSPYLYI